MSHMKFLAYSKNLFAALAFIGLASAASADVIRVKPTFVNGDPYADIIMSSAYEGTVTQWTATAEATGESFIAYCIEIAQALQQNAPLEYTRSAYAPSAEVSELYDRYYAASKNDETKALAFQSALWMLLDQLPSNNVYDYIEFQPYITLGQQWVETIRASDDGFVAGQYEFYRWSNSVHQDILQVLAAHSNEVPEPHTHALLLGGLGLLLAMRRAARRRAERS